jgi:hypothetical protein
LAGAAGTIDSRGLKFIAFKERFVDFYPTFAAKFDRTRFFPKNTFLSCNRINNLLIPGKTVDNQQTPLDKNNLSLYKKK